LRIITQQGKRWWLRLHEKGGKHHDVPAHHGRDYGPGERVRE
jgi:hypothetical protein